MPDLLLLRHGQSQWNLENRFTGWIDVPLSPRGEAEARVLPLWTSDILPGLRAGQNVLVVAHGNSLRALVMHLNGLTREQVLELEIPTGVPLLYELADDGTVRGKRYL